MADVGQFYGAGDAVSQMYEAGAAVGLPAIVPFLRY